MAEIVDGGAHPALSLLGLDAPITVEVALVVVDVRYSVLASSDARLMDVMGIGAEDSGRGLALDGVPTTISTSISLTQDCAREPLMRPSTRERG